MVRSPRLRARALVAASVWATATPTGCATHSGDWSRRAAPEQLADDPPSQSEGHSEGARSELRLFLIGDTGAARRHGEAIAERLAARIDESEAAGVPSVLVWLGDNATPKRCDKGRGRLSQRAQPFADLADAHPRERGRASVSTVGELDWRCGVAERIAAGQGQTSSGSMELADAWPQPALNYVVRLDAQGVGKIVSRCTGVAPVCTIAPDTGQGLVELVVLDTAAWLGSVPPSSIAATDRSIAEQRALLASLGENPPTAALQRILVSHYPIESAGPHGQGGLYPDSALLFHDEPLQSAVLRGDFAGAISGHERSLQASSDITPAVQRSSRLWPERPFFQVVSGAGGRGDAGAGPRSWPFYQSIALAPDNVSNYPGFAELTITEDAFVVVLHARRLGRWENAQTVIPRRPVPPPAERSMPGLEPCLGCDTRDPREQAIAPRP